VRLINFGWRFSSCVWRELGQAMPRTSFANFSSTSAAASKAARGNRRTGTSPELLLRHALFASGFRYRLHAADVPGVPDIVVRKRKIAIFCDGDFWHGRNWRRRRILLGRGANALYWINKISGNMSRDRSITRELRHQGWLVIRVWEGDVKRSPTAVAQAIRLKIDSKSR
jgi:DNA mismatch endonuclease, patch repair protein